MLGATLEGRPARRESAESGYPASQRLMMPAEIEAKICPASTTANAASAVAGRLVVAAAGPFERVALRLDGGGEDGIRLI